MPRGTLDTSSLFGLSLTGMSPSVSYLSRYFQLDFTVNYLVRNPGYSAVFPLVGS